MNKQKEKVAFIICCNNEQYLKECEVYINTLIIPDNFSIEIIPVRGARSMCSGYNIGMKSTDAKYKVYMHQDVFILNRNFISDFLKVFETDEEIGIIGVVGSSNLPKDGMCFSDWDTGSILECDGYRVFMYLPSQESAINYVWAVDGCMVITNRDLPWREDRFDSWDFYDISQGMEYFEAGYRVAVPYQEHPWCFHDSGILNLNSYDRNRRIFCETYSKYFEYDETEEHRKKREEEAAFSYEIEKLLPQIRKLFDGGKYAEAVKALSGLREYKNKDNELLSLYTISAIIVEEWKNGKDCLIKCGKDTEGLLREYQSLRFMLFRLAADKELDVDLRKMVDTGEISEEALTLLVDFTIYDKTKVYRKLMELGISVPLPVKEPFSCPLCSHSGSIIRYKGEEKQRQHDYAFHHYLSVIENYTEDHVVCPDCGADSCERFISLFIKELKADDGQKLVGLNLLSGDSNDDNKFGCLKGEEIEWITEKPELLKLRQSESTDLILGINLLQNAKDDHQVISEIYRVLKKDGIGIIVLPIIHGLIDTIEAGETGDASRMQKTGEYKARRLYAEWDLVNRLVNCGFLVQKIMPEYFGEPAKDALIDEFQSMFIITKKDLGIQGLAMREFHPDFSKKVSVILPTYNRERSLERAVRSVLSQSWPNIELLVVDDGSKDGTPLIMEKLLQEDNRIRYIRYEKNQGASHARNVGIENASGEYIAFQDSDDEWDREHVRKLVIELMFRGPDYGMTFCDFEIKSERFGNIRVPVEDFDKRNLSGYIFPYLLTHFFISTQCVMIRREILEKTGGFNEGLHAMEDWELFLRISRISLVSEVPEVLVDVADTESSVGEHHMAHAEAFMYVCKLYDLENTNSEAYQELLKRTKERLELI